MIKLEEFIRKSNKAISISDLKLLFLEYLSQWGFNSFMFSDLTFNSNIKKNIDLVANYPIEWLNHYNDKDYSLIDPVFQQTQISTRPFYWDDLLIKNKNSKQVMAEAREFSLNSGIGIPLYFSPDHYYGIGVASPYKDIEKNNDNLYIIHAAANHFSLIYMKLNKIDISSTIIGITPREKDILRLLSDGLTKKSISEFLDISESTIKRHCENIFSKLGVHNLHGAVSRAYKLGILI